MLQGRETVTASCGAGNFAVDGGCHWDTGTGRDDLPAGVVNGSAGTAATGWTCTTTANDPDNITAYALCCPLPSDYDFSLHDEGSISSAGSAQTIRGFVEFVRRQGIVPGSLDSISYWSVVIHADGMDYGLSKVFGIEMGSRPESTALAGKVIHPGDQVTVQGQVARISENLGLMSRIGGVELK